MLEDLRPPGRSAELRRLAGYADDLDLALDTIAESAWALDDLYEAASALEGLQRHRHTLERLSELDGLVDDIQELARDFREARACHEELSWAIEEFEAEASTRPRR